ncbi:MAG: hypothetical protein HRT95_00505 [Moritella sp.]|uniref:hypothetical protein n=1 Tax=Moritella sp. TaxID=78556 RepID=UPI001DA9A0B7|nr:hypothetical protein [Moritella sp.]NQZ48698.1 hypothetical protein [Moritella sp.]
MNKKTLIKNLVLTSIVVTMSGCASMKKPENPVGVSHSHADGIIKSVSITVPEGMNLVMKNSQSIYNPKNWPLAEGFTLNLNESEHTFTYMNYICSSENRFEETIYIKEKGTSCYVLAVDPEVPKEGRRAKSTGTYTVTINDGIQKYKFVPGPASIKYHDMQPIFMQKFIEKDVKASARNLFSDIEVEDLTGDFKYKHSLASLNAGLKRHFGTKYAGKWHNWSKYDYQSGGRVVNVKTELYGAGSMATYVISPGISFHSNDKVNLELDGHTYVMNAMAAMDEIKAE